ncbi:hypothetical protein MCP1_180018 [Candidatus Terasakiella magnetica]|nr:hypothetical protein MCP1_180018 [Candidatus Terasakiella magnetica]
MTWGALCPPCLFCTPPIMVHMRFLVAKRQPSRDDWPQIRHQPSLHAILTNRVDNFCQMTFAGETIRWHIRRPLKEAIPQSRHPEIPGRPRHGR